MNIVEKILARAAGKDQVSPDDVIFANIDKVMLHDVSGPGVIKVFDKLKKQGINVDKLWDPSKVWVAEDHFVPSADKISAENIVKLQNFTKNYGIEKHFKYGMGQYGICHTLSHEEALVLPGDVYVGGDSHTNTTGALGAPADSDKPVADTDRPATSHLPPTQNKLPPKKNKKADTGIERIAAQLAKAKTIEDVDDKLAETLFGEEINLIAAEVLANPELYDSANDKDQAEEQNAPNIAKSDDSAPGEVSLEPLPLPTDTGHDLTASQRLNTVRALNANTKSAASKPAPKPAPADTPGSFEDQINTSLTQTLKALDVKPPLSDDDDDNEETKGGFLNRFKLS